MWKLLTLFFVGLPAGFANTIEFTVLPANTEFGTYNGFVPALIDGSPGQLLVCDDYDHTTYVPSGILQYSQSTLGSLQYVRFINQSFAFEQAQYEQAALLVDGLAHTGPSHNPDQTGDYQYALWHLFTPSVPLMNANQQSLLDQTAHAVATNPDAYSDLYSRLRIYTPTQPYASNQEFLELADAPEPPAAGLMGIGIGLFLAGAGARRLRGAPPG